MEKVEMLDFEENKPVKKKKLKKWVKILMFFIIIISFLIIFYTFFLSPVSRKSKTVLFTVDSGSSVYSVGKKLKDKNIIRSYYAYKVYVKLKNVKGYKAGIYKIDKSYDTNTIIKILSGKYYKDKGVTITFKEGKNILGVAKEIASKTNITQSEVLEKISNEEYINSLIDTYWFLTDDIKNKDIYYPLEGYLFPDTYSFKEDVKIEDIIKTMLDQTNKVFSKYKAQIDSSNYSIHELSSLASIIEKEGIYDNDRKKIASVFYNRLNSGMSLGSDVTTYYAFKVDLGKRDLTKEEINTYNPYNTRGPLMNGKLPVGPICNFGESSFIAALTPESTDYYYFVADKSGKTHFTKTYEEHQKIIKELKAANNWLEF